MFNAIVTLAHDRIEIESELPDAPETPPVMGSYPLQSEAGDVFAGSVSRVRIPAVAGVSAVERGHQTIPRDLREYGRASDAEAPRIAMHHRSMRHGQSAYAIAVDQHMVRRELQSRERATHGQHARLVDVDAVYLAH